MKSTVRHTKRWLLALAAIALIIGPAQAQQEIPLGTQMPVANQSLPQAGGGQASLSSLAGNNGTVVVFWSNNCTWVDKYESRVLDLARTFGGQGFSFVLVNSNDASSFPKESLEGSAERAQQKSYPMPYLRDEGGQLAKAFGAERTPHVFVFDSDNTLAYVGTIDDSPGDPGNVKENYLRSALEALAQGQAVSTSKTKAFGCTIKTP